MIENFYFNKAVKPIFKTHYEQINKSLGTHFTNIQVQDFIDKIKLTPNKIKKFNHYLLNTLKCSKLKIDENQLLANSEFIDVIDDNIDEKLFEIYYNDEKNNTRKGTMSFTSCHELNDDKRIGDGFIEYNNCRFIVSTAAQFLGSEKYKHLKRILLFKLKKNISLFLLEGNTIDEYNQQRNNLMLEYTKLLLTSKFNNDKYEEIHEENYDFSIKNENGEVIKLAGCVNSNNCLPEYFIYYFLDLYNEEYYNKDDEKEEQHIGFIILDTPGKPTSIITDTLPYHYIGFEFRIYSAQLYVSFEGLYCLNNNSFFLNDLNKSYIIEKDKLVDLDKDINDITEFLNIINDDIIVHDTYIFNFNKWILFVKQYINMIKIKNIINHEQIIDMYKDICNIIISYCKEYRQLVKEKNESSLIINKYYKYKIKFLTLKNKYSI
jgi:hypothetical protein